MNFESIVCNISNLIDLNEEEINWFTTIIEAKEFKKKEFILRANDICHYQTYIIKGCLKISYVDGNGIENIVKFAIEDWWVYDLQSFMTQTPARYSIQVIEEAETFQLSKRNYDLLHERIPKFEKFSRIMFQNSYIQLQNRVTQNLSATAEEKYRHFSGKVSRVRIADSAKEDSSLPWHNSGISKHASKKKENPFNFLNYFNFIRFHSPLFCLSKNKGKHETTIIWHRKRLGWLGP